MANPIKRLKDQWQTRTSHRKFRRAANSALAALREGQPCDGSYRDLFSRLAHLDRVLFVHVPKCGGTSMRKSLVTDIGCLPIPAEGAASMQQATFYLAAALDPFSVEQSFFQQFVNGAEEGDLEARFQHALAASSAIRRPAAVCPIGHLSLQQLAPLHRGERDRLIATVRAPIDILRSLVRYRVYRVMQGGEVSQRVLRKLELPMERFSALAADDPRELVARILRSEPVSLCAALTVAGDGTAQAAWADIKAKQVFVAHMSEQRDMLQQLFGGELPEREENTSVDRQGPGASFGQLIEDAWLESFLDPEDLAFYERFELSGLPGFWHRGGSAQAYRELLASA